MILNSRANAVNHRFSLIYLAVASLSLSNAFAAESITDAAEDTVRSNETWVVTGTRTERLLEDTPVRTEVISREQIDNQHARNVSEALKTVPGLMLKDIHGKGGQEVWLQGLDADRVLILVNGRPVTASTGSSVDVSQLATADIERIEIVKGATSALYGSSAMGGVVNIITRRPDKEFSLSVTADAGSYGQGNIGNSDLSLGGRAQDISSRYGQLNLGMNKGNWSAVLNGSIRDTDGYDLDLDTPSRDGSSGTKTNVSARLAYETSSGNEYFVEPSYYKEDLVAENLLFTPGVGYRDKTEVAERKHLDTGARFQFGEDKLALYLTQETFSDTTEKGDIRTAEQKILRGSVQWDTPLSDNQLLTLGADLSQAELEQYLDKPTLTGYQRTEEIGNGTDNKSAELFVQNDIFLGSHWELLPGVRYQYDSDFGSHYTPKVNLSYTPDWFDAAEMRIRAGVGMGYRVPNLKERYYVFDHSNLGYMVMGNPDLQPERSDSYQIGAELSFPSGLSMDLSLYRNNLTDLITSASNADHPRSTPSVVIYEYLNIDRATITGAELALKGQWRHLLYWDAALTLMDTENASTGKQLTGRPQQQFKTGLTLKPGSGFSASLLGSYQSKSFSDVDNEHYTPAWSTWDLKLNQQINPHLKVYLGVDNLADVTKDPSDPHDQGPHPGRFVYSGLRVDL
jgi:outer membrane receptor for ferrienterochelin and colicins